MIRVTPTVKFAARNYRNPKLVHVSQFVQDYKRFEAVARVLRKWVRSGGTSNMNVPLLLIELQIIFEMFDEDAARAIFIKILQTKFHSCLKSFLVYIEQAPTDFITHIDIDVDLIEKIKNESCPPS